MTYTVFRKLPSFKLQLVHFSTYGTFTFCYNFLINIQNMVLFFLGHFINFIEFDFYFSQIFLFWGVFSYFLAYLISCITRIRVS